MKEAHNRATIGVDVDDVCLELMPVWLDEHKARTGEHILVENVLGWGLDKYTNHGAQIYEVLKEPGLYDYVPAVAQAKEGLRTLRQAYDVVFVTANDLPSVESKRRALVRHGLEHHKDVQRTVCMIPDKRYARVDLLIDDRAENIEAFPGPAILFDRPWNQWWKVPQNREWPGVRCASWAVIPSFVDVLLDYTAGKAKGRW